MNYAAVVTRLYKRRVNRLRRNRAWAVFWLAVSAALFTGCGHRKPDTSSSISSLTEETQEPSEKVTENVQEESKADENGISVRMVKKYIKEKKADLEETLTSAKEKELSVETREYNGEPMFFLICTPEDTSFSVLYRIRLEEETVAGLDFIASGMHEYLKFDIVTLSEGNYIAVYSASNVGNGNLLFVDINKLYGRQNGADPDFQMLAVDAHYEKLPCNGSNYTLSKVFSNGILIPEYKDIDGDGNTDVILSGIVETYQSEKDSEDFTLESRQDVTQMYLYDDKEKKFTLQSSQDLTEKAPMTWNDMMVNNHVLLNETPYAIVTLKEMLDCHKEVPSVLVEKAGNGQYWHYYGYKGITYVFLGKKTLSDFDCLNYVILTDNSYSLTNGIQVGMREEDLAKTSLDFTKFPRKQVGSGKSLSTLFLNDKKGLINTLVEKYDSIYYVSGEVDALVQTDEEQNPLVQQGLIVVVKDGKVICVSTDQPDL